MYDKILVDYWKCYQAPDNYKCCSCNCNNVKLWFVQGPHRAINNMKCAICLESSGIGVVNIPNNLNIGKWKPAIPHPTGDLFAYPESQNQELKWWLSLYCKRQLCI